MLTFNNRLDIVTGIGFAVDASLLFGDNLSIVRRFFMRSMIIRKNNVSFSKDHDWKKKKKKTWNVRTILRRRTVTTAAPGGTAKIRQSDQA